MTEFYTKAVSELREIYNHLNKDYYDGELPEVVITIQSSPKGKAYGWFAKDRWGIETDKEKAFGVQIDSLADVISFLMFPVVFALFNSDNKILAMIVAGIYVLAGVERLGWFNVNQEEGKTRYYDGLPVTYSALIIPIVNVVFELLKIQFKYTNYIILVILAFLYVVNVKMKKPTGVWYIIFSCLAIATIVVIHLV
jgi:CDP-diacylglycerol--serine O-phosphatidyltransferase